MLISSTSEHSSSLELQSSYSNEDSNLPSLYYSSSSSLLSSVLLSWAASLQEVASGEQVVCGGQGDSDHPIAPIYVLVMRGVALDVGVSYLHLGEGERMTSSSSFSSTFRSVFQPSSYSFCRRRWQRFYGKGKQSVYNQVINCSAARKQSRCGDRLEIQQEIFSDFIWYYDFITAVKNIILLSIYKSVVFSKRIQMYSFLIWLHILNLANLASFFKKKGQFSHFF